MIQPNIHKLKNGLTVVLDFIPHVESSTVAIFTNIGSRIEDTSNSGICHFLEHMVFKGTKTKESFVISETIENKGGYINAWTSKEKTAWYAKVLKEDVLVAIDLLLDIIRNSTFPKEELEKERGVIIEEIKMYLDDPQDLLYNNYKKIAYKDHPLGTPIIGNEKNIKQFSNQDFHDHLNKYYGPDNMVVVISGNFKEELFLKELEQLVTDWQPKNIKLNLEQPKLYSGQDIIVKKEFEQTHILYGLEAVSYKDPEHYKWVVLSLILGGGMSSRFFKEIREKRGLAYSVNTSLACYADTGTMVTYIGCNKDKAQEVINILKENMVDVSSTLTEKELTKAKNMLKSSMVMTMESTYKRSVKMASNMIDFGKIKDVNQLINKINNVQIDDISAIITSVVNKEPILSIVSNENINLKVN